MDMLMMKIVSYVLASGYFFIVLEPLYNYKIVHKDIFKISLFLGLFVFSEDIFILKTLSVFIICFLVLFVIIKIRRRYDLYVPFILLSLSISLVLARF